jgi:hypothetical protein
MGLGSRIPKAIPKPKRRPNPKRAAQHLAFVRLLPCLACGRLGPSQAAHVRKGTDGGTGTKPADRYTVPACAACHGIQHRRGEITFWGELGLDPLNIALRLWTVSGDEDAGRRLIERSLLSRGIAA